MNSQLYYKRYNSKNEDKFFLGWSERPCIYDEAYEIGKKIISLLLKNKKIRIREAGLNGPSVYSICLSISMVLGKRYDLPTPSKNALHKHLKYHVEKSSEKILKVLAANGDLYLIENDNELVIENLINEENKLMLLEKLENSHV